MLTDGRTDSRTDDGQKVITIAHLEQSSGELKTHTHRYTFFNPKNVTANCNEQHSYFFYFSEKIRLHISIESFT